MRFASFLDGEITTMAVINPPERKLAKCTSMQPFGHMYTKMGWFLADRLVNHIKPKILNNMYSNLVFNPEF